MAWTAARDRLECRPPSAWNRARDQAEYAGIVVELLPQVLEELERDHPGIDVEVCILGSAEAMLRLAAGTLDIGLVAVPQPAMRGLVVTRWRSQPMMAFVPKKWEAPKRVTPRWLAERPLISNDSTTNMYRLTMEWFAAIGESPRPRIELNFDAAMLALVAAGYGAAVLPLHQPVGADSNERLQVLPLSPKLTRHLGIAHRPRASLDGATESVLRILERFSQR